MVNKFNYTKLKNEKVIPLIERFGTDIVLKRIEDTDTYVEDFDPVAMRSYWENTITGEKVYEEPEPVATTYQGICLNTQYSTEDIDGTNVKVGDRQLLTLQIPKPDAGEVVTVSGTDFSVVRSEQVDPGGVVLFYRVQVRL